MIDFEKYPINYETLPNMEGSVRRYIENRLEPGGFLAAIITNDLAGAFSRADSTNIKLIQEFITWFYNHAPASCWGSPEVMRNWLNPKTQEDPEHENQS